MNDILQKGEMDNIYEKDFIVLVLTIENTDDQKWLKDPNYLASRYFDPIVAYPLKGNNNYRGFYEQILIETGSVNFEHFYLGQKDRTSPFFFSKAYLKNILTPTDWGLDPNRPRHVTGSPKMNFSYWDYKDVWYCCFYYDNPQKKHTLVLPNSP